MDIRAAEISAILKQQIANFGTEAEVAEVGQVLSVGDGIARVYGLDSVKAGEMVEFPGGIKGLTRNFIGAVAANGRARELVAMATAFLAELANRRGETTVAVTSAVPLSPAQLQQLNDSLRGVLGSNKISIDARVEPEILGGLVVKVGSRLFDSSIRSKLQRLQLAMKGVA